ncbi:enolase C-terminal domain-like protein [Streptomyces sp. H27-D2]|uniref:enolase C-terminal domain-like protein n=1 Tax=Streptomyces sp. H27-D2 TaxID=3046304 RepID=UPI002DB78FC1|nr:enolase C-terminal domain-like protein [Streptomyces sp. H27-D2]MEC4020420.1 enolase C-terminal domain-like protein [Streptomyces sp. H27-D2]
MKLAVHTTSLELREPLRISRSVMSRRDAVWLRLEHDGALGHGEAVSSVYLGLSAEQAVRCLYDLAPALARLPDPQAALAAQREGTLLPARTPAGVAAAVDAALLDLVGKRAGKPAGHLLGNPFPEAAAVATARTIGIVAPDRAEQQARTLARRGFTVLKVKAGSADPAEDLDRVAAVRAGAGPRSRVLLDPNGAWTVARAEELLPRFAALGVEAVEQPTAAGAPDALARLAEHSPLPIIADEDATGYEDAMRLAGRVQGVNIKLAKCGGAQQALRICDALEGSGTDVMLGCLTASSLGIAPAVHLAHRARWVDLDGHLLLAHDPWTGIGGADGTVRAPAGPGLGVTRAPAAPGGGAASPPSAHDPTRYEEAPA